MSKLASLAKDTAIYGLSSIVGRFLNYMLVPLYTHTLSSCADYGIMNDLYAQVALLLVILTFGMETTFFRFANRDDEDPRRVFSTALTMVAGVAVAFLLLVLGGLPWVSDALGYGSHPEYIAVMSIIVAMDAVQAILFSLLRYQKKAIKFASLKMGFILLSCTLNLLAYALLPHWVEGWPITVGYAFVINLVCTSTIMVCQWRELRLCRPAMVDRALMRRMLQYSWPLLILGIAGILNQVAGQLMLPRLLPQEEGRTALGIYGACLKVAMIMAMITQAFRYAYEPFVFGGVKDKNNPEMLARVMKYFIIFTLLAFLAVVAYMPVLQYLVGSEYREGLRIVPICMVAEILMGVYFNLSFWYKLTDRTIFGTWFSLAGCASLILTNWLLVPTMGYEACAWAGVVGYGVCTLLSYCVGQRYMPIPYPLLSIGVYVAITALFFAVMSVVPAYISNVWLQMTLNTGVLLAFVAHVAYHDLRPILQSRKASRALKQSETLSE